MTMDTCQIIVPICGIDTSCVGLSINGWTIEKVNKNNVDDHITDKLPNDLYNKIKELIYTEDTLLSMSFFYNDINIDDPEEPDVESKESQPYFLILYKETDKYDDIIPIMNALRMCSSSQVGCWYPLAHDNGLLKPTDCRIQYSHDVLQNDFPKLQRSKIETKEFDKLLHAIIHNKTSSVVQLMRSFFHEACRTTNRYLSFIMRIIIMEMIVNGNGELVYRISRYIAVLLGKNKEESKQIYDNIKKMYTARSCFLHDGKYEKITDLYIELAFDYSRRVIANLMMINEDIETVRNTLDQAGYGDNPYSVIF